MRHDDWCDAITNYMHDGVRPYYYLHTFDAQQTAGSQPTKVPTCVLHAVCSQLYRMHNERKTNHGANAPVVKLTEIGFGCNRIIDRERDEKINHYSGRCESPINNGRVNVSTNNSTHMPPNQWPFAIHGDDDDTNGNKIYILKSLRTHDLMRKKFASMESLKCQLNTVRAACDRHSPSVAHMQNKRRYHCVIASSASPTKNMRSPPTRSSAERTKE